MHPTSLEYLEDMRRCESTATILGSAADEQGRAVLFLDKTVFYPQGGGQPCDTGHIAGDGFKFDVQSVRFMEGIVHHIGIAIEGQPQVGKNVNLAVDKVRRGNNSRLHSGGHLIDNAMKNAGETLIPTKGFHFPEGPNVEYEGEIPEEKRNSLVAVLQSHLDRMIGLDLPVTTRFVAVEKLSELCANVPSNLPKDKPIRVVSIDGLHIPCGGTHVRSLGELKGMKVEKIKSKKGVTKVSYTVPTHP